MAMRRLLPVTMLAAAALAGCGSSSNSSSIKAAPSANPPSNQASSAAPTPAPPASGPLSSKPHIARPSGAAPKKLIVKDLIPGTGPAAASGQTLSVEYVGVTFKDGKQFDASWDRNKMPFSFALGAGNVIPGWDQGLVGMKVGGRRQLVIPSALAYGPQGRPPAIPPNAALVFDIDLLAAN